MANPFETVILNMRNTGMFQFMLPFMLSSAIFYGLLRKSQIFGDPQKSVTVNAVVALVASFMVWAAPILLGIDIETKLASFFLQGISVMLVVMVGLMIVGMVVPTDLPAHFKTVFEKNTKVWMAILVGGILAGIIIATSSGFMNIYFPSGGVGGMAISQDTINALLVVFLMIGSVLALVALGR